MKRWIICLSFLLFFFSYGNVWARGGGGCFLPDTPILLANGLSIAISQIKPGDKVRAYNTDGTLVTATVSNIITHQVDAYYIVTTKKIVLNVTAEHPFFVGQGTFKTVEALTSGDIIYTFDGDKLTPQPILHIDPVKAQTTVYNLQTTEPHTYFAAGIAVHNKGGGCFPAGTRVKTPSGSTPIELLATADPIVTIDKSGREFVTHVDSTFATRSALLIIDTDQGTLRTTAEHPLAVSSRKFLKASQLSSHDSILFEKHGKLISATIQSVRHSPESIVFNLQVGFPHTFIANGFLVHNKGGGGFSSSGGSRGSSGNSKNSCPEGDIACEIKTFIFLIIGYGIISFIFSFFKSNRKDKDLDFSYSPRQIKPKAEKTLKLLNFLARQDQMMAPALLEKTTRAIFLKLQECWVHRDYVPMKDLMMPDLFVQHNRQIAGMVRNHEINRLDNLSINRIDLVNVRYTEQKNQREFTALVSATASDYYLDDRTITYIRGNRTPANFQEFWTFQLQDGKWLLREIEQTGESSILKEENFFEQFTDKQVEKVYQDAVDKLGVAGPWLEKGVLAKTSKVERMLNFLARSDKIWDRQLILNRIREVFNNVHMALEAGELDSAVTAQLFPAVAESCKQTLDEQKSLGESTEYRNFCVRKVEIILVRSYNDNSQDEFVARISAHAQRVHRKGAAILSQDADVTPFEEYWTFGRLDNQWKLKEALPKAAGQQAITAENIEEETSPDLVKWYYTKKRAL